MSTHTDPTQTGISVPNPKHSIYAQTNLDWLLLCESDINIELRDFLESHFKKDVIFSTISLIVSLVGLLCTSGNDCKIIGIDINYLKPFFFTFLLCAIGYLIYIFYKLAKSKKVSTPEHFIEQLRKHCKKVDEQ